MMNKKGLQWYYTAGLIIALVVVFVVLGGAGRIWTEIRDAVKATPDFRNDVQIVQGEEIVRYYIPNGEVAYRENGEWQIISSKGILFDSGREFDRTSLVEAFDEYYYDSSRASSDIILSSNAGENFYPDREPSIGNIKARPVEVLRESEAFYIDNDFGLSSDMRKELRPAPVVKVNVISATSSSTEAGSPGKPHAIFYVMYDGSYDLVPEHSLGYVNQDETQDHKKVVADAIRWRNNIAKNSISIRHRMEGQELEDSFQIEKVGDYLVVRFPSTA